ncbi:hypothetical protein AKO1_006620 [Acrasis kona]|uniref:Uncharacterized protein n=1 Tax=Acrasis kona TaxID=1008807 RepID=A0AAW2ZJS7_9EUKA
MVQGGVGKVRDVQFQQISGSRHAIVEFESLPDAHRLDIHPGVLLSCRHKKQQPSQTQDRTKPPMMVNMLRGIVLNHDFEFDQIKPCDSLKVDMVPMFLDYSRSAIISSDSVAFPALQGNSNVVVPALFYGVNDNSVYYANECTVLSSVQLMHRCVLLFCADSQLHKRNKCTFDIQLQQDGPVVSVTGKNELVESIANHRNYIFECIRFMSRRRHHTHATDQDLQEMSPVRTIESREWLMSILNGKSGDLKPTVDEKYNMNLSHQVKSHLCSNVCRQVIGDLTGAKLIPDSQGMIIQFGDDDQLDESMRLIHEWSQLIVGEDVKSIVLVKTKDESMDPPQVTDVYYGELDAASGQPKYKLVSIRNKYADEDQFNPNQKDVKGDFYYCTDSMLNSCLSKFDNLAVKCFMGKHEYMPQDSIVPLTYNRSGKPKSGTGNLVAEFIKRKDVITFRSDMMISRRRFDDYLKNQRFEKVSDLTVCEWRVFMDVVDLTESVSIQIEFVVDSESNMKFVSCSTNHQLKNKLGLSVIISDPLDDSPDLSLEGRTTTVVSNKDLSDLLKCVEWDTKNGIVINTDLLPKDKYGFGAVVYEKKDEYKDKNNEDVRLCISRVRINSMDEKSQELHIYATHKKNDAKQLLKAVQSMVVEVFGE